jgi:SAM-dependent methyltransferase
MSTSPPFDPATDFYEQNAAAYAERTLALDMEPLYGSFLDLLPAGGHILDAGCGSGRDAREFKRRGYVVTAIDASPAMARVAAEVIGQPVEVLRFEDMAYTEVFDGIWASASLLHVPRARIDEMFRRFSRALRPGGVWYMSFKKGEGERLDCGRFFNDYDEWSLGELLRRHHDLEVMRLWRTGSLEPGGEERTWVNALVRNKGGVSRTLTALHGPCQ